MGIELWVLFLVALLYLGTLFLIAYCADCGLIPQKVVNHPIVYALSLGVYATSWTYYGSVGLANSSGFAFLNIYLGVTAAFILGPYLLKPILRLCRDYQLASVADLLAFRYGGRATGSVVTVFMLLGVLPYISLQIHAVTESIQVLSKQVPPNLLALIFCIAISVFAVLFGARHLTPREKHSGLVTAIAFESAVKLAALIVAGIFVTTQVFDGVGAMNTWAQSHPEELKSLYKPANTSLWSTLLLLSFSAAFLLPRQYHMTFVENENPNALKTAYWLFPLYLLLLNLPIIPILWAGKHLSLTLPADFYMLGIALTLGNEWLAILIYIGGLSAASAMMIVTSLALSYMCLNHLFLPASLSATRPDTNLYRRILWSKRIIIAAIIAAGYGFYLVIELNEGLASLGLISFVAVVQLLPGMIGLLFWTRATQAGFLSGLIGGAMVWFILLVLPLLIDTASISSMENLSTNLGFTGIDVWSLASFCSLTVNCFLYLSISLLTRQSSVEIEAADACTPGNARPLQSAVYANSAADFTHQLEELLGSEAAEQEVQRALDDLALEASETRQPQLRLLHEKLERNLSGLLGPTVARLALRSNIHLAEPTDIALAESLRFTEARLETQRLEMRGLTRELDDLRRYLREVLQELPLGVCSLSPAGDILIWNSAMQTISGISEQTARRGNLKELPGPWNTLLSEFAESNDNHSIRKRTIVRREPASFNLHKAEVANPLDSALPAAGQVILVEDRTSLDILESELAHSERLASIGRLSAGVAHEIGNPLTGIASIAQNLIYNIEPESLKEDSSDILTQVERINAIVKSLLTFSRNDASIGDDYQPTDLNVSIAESIQLVKLSDQANQINIVVDLPEALMVNANGRQMVQIFVNLLNNACDASEHGQTVNIMGRRENNSAVIVVHDQGTGINQNDQQHIFEPFFTTKAVGQGTGLGLPLVYSLVTQHGGRISFDSDPQLGTSFEIRIPLITGEHTNMNTIK